MKVRTGVSVTVTGTISQFVRTTHGQIYYWWLWHRRRIRHVVIIQIIFAQGEWSSAKYSRPIFKDTRLNSNKHSVLRRNVYVSSWKESVLMGKNMNEKFYISSTIQERISQWNCCLTYLKSFSPDNQVTSMERVHLTWMILYCIYLLFVMKKSFARQRICWILEEEERRSSINYFLGKQVDVYGTFSTT